MNTSSVESRARDRNAWNSNFIIMEPCRSLASPSLKHHLESQTTELVPFKLLRLTRLLFFSFEKRSDKTGYGPLNHRLRAQAPSQRIHKLERLHHYGIRKQRVWSPVSGLWPLECDCLTLTHSSTMLFALPTIPQVRYQAGSLNSHSKKKDGAL